MTGERAKRFPLGLEDLVREPRRSEARSGDARPAKTAVLDGRLSGGPGAGGNSGTASSIGAGARGARVGVTAKRNEPADSSAKRITSGTASGITSGTASTRQQPALRLPASPERAGAPNVPLNRAHALTSERVRERMVERLRANGVADPRVLDAMATVPRHMFVDPGLATQAYEDAALPIGHHQTISKPSVVARMIELAAAGRELNNVLEIGTGCGYQAAVLSQLARDVYSIERIKPLYERAKTNLRPLRIPNIRLHYGDGRIGLPAVAPFDAIVIAAAGLDVPQALLEQLAIGARLVAPVGTQDGQTQVLTLVERTGPAQWRESRLDRVFFVPLKSGVI
ncbi:protein-L-isoaspartate(D-aspartate) O-methyltransferase [Paraburkholderia sp. SOS3]|uniref:protein-L-isoaspartate(D-aspartate) O-methyltransferase n=1 Tax=Paraburkholderia sp. SOS3 TaxID=1926494 RepID=UPI0009478210|nr:protein-L-isoaspartate(D-aspartate) O-methyltransferase [Paraburkholderia sp. SOS3]APR36102.1 protein-L-isoaspartate O-methyltransferase [Paraburkholderia sp. SOS3]